MRVDGSVFTVSKVSLVLINVSLGESVIVFRSFLFYSGLVPGAYFISVNSKI